LLFPSLGIVNSFLDDGSQNTAFISFNHDNISQYCVDNYDKFFPGRFIFPAILIGYLLSTNSITTKLSFVICSISVSRLLEHFGDDQPEKINTLASFYMNYGLNMCVGDIIRSKTKKILKDLIKILIVIADRVEFKTAKKINYIKKSVEKQLEIFRGKSKDIENLSKIHESINNVICTLNSQMKKLENDAKKHINFGKNEANNNNDDKKYDQEFFKFIKMDQEEVVIDEIDIEAN
ncbi:13970_t:CDS:2, partial [Dentiscutata heterogama]